MRCEEIYSDDVTALMNGDELAFEKEAIKHYDRVKEMDRLKAEGKLTDEQEKSMGVNRVVARQMMFYAEKVRRNIADALDLGGSPYVEIIDSVGDDMEALKRELLANEKMRPAIALVEYLHNMRVVKEMQRARSSKEEDRLYIKQHRAEKNLLSAQAIAYLTEKGVKNAKKKAEILTAAIYDIIEKGELYEHKKRTTA